MDKSVQFFFQWLNLFEGTIHGFNVSLLITEGY